MKSFPFYNRKGQIPASAKVQNHLRTKMTYSVYIQKVSARELIFCEHCKNFKFYSF